MTDVLKPTLELRSIEFSERMSEETHCYSAKLYVDGVLFGFVSNHGHGGSTDVRSANGGFAGVAELDERVKATFGRTEPCEVFPEGMEIDLEFACDRLLEDWLIRRDYTKTAKRKALFRKSATDEGLYEMPFKAFPPVAVFEAIRKKYPEAIILNSLPETEALRLFRGASV
jgi:hypothetical protein